MQRASSSQTKVNHPAYKLDLLAYDSLRITFANAFELDSTSRFNYRTSIKCPISVPVSPSNAVECYPCREVPLNYNRSLLFHGDDMGQNGNETVGIEVVDSGSRGKDGTGVGANRPK
jgi:hypothetical protein